MMKKRVGILIAALIILVGGLLLLSSNKNEPQRPSVTIDTPSPTPHPDEPLIRKLVQEFIPKWGTYSYKDFTQYQARISPLLTKELREKSFGEAQLPFRLKALARDHFEIVTELEEVKSVRVEGESLIVEATARQVTTSIDGSNAKTVTYKVTYVHNGELYKVSEVKSDG